MADSEKTSHDIEEASSRKTASPLVFISHDTRDADLAEAFSKLLKSVSAGMLKSFRSSDKKGQEGIEFGDEWYKRLMDKLDSASDVVCLFTKRSLERPWILYEAGVAKGKLSKPVLGLALGISLSEVATGPFFQFQNSDDSEDSLIKLLKQLAGRIPSLELDDDVVKAQIQGFRDKTAEILKTMDSTPEEDDSVADGAAKVMEEMKLMIRDLPSRIESRIGDDFSTKRRRKMKSFHPMMFERLMFSREEEPNPIMLLLAASLIRDHAPWLYEIGVESYRTLQFGTIRDAERLLRSLERSEKLLMGGPLMEEFIDDAEIDMIVHEFPRMLRHMIKHIIAKKRTTREPK